MKGNRSDPRRSTKEQKAITAKMNDQLREALKKMGIPPDEWEERYNEISSSVNLQAVGADVCKP